MVQLIFHCGHFGLGGLQQRGGCFTHALLLVSVGSKEGGLNREMVALQGDLIEQVSLYTVYSF